MQAQERKSKLQQMLAECVNAASSPHPPDPVHIRRSATIESADDARISLLERRFEVACERIEGQVKGSQKLTHVVDSLTERLAATERGLRELQSGFARVVESIEHLEPDCETSETEAEREATANVLSSLTKLVEGMRAGQLERTSL